MEVRTNGARAEQPEQATIRIAAAGDVHVSDVNADAAAAACPFRIVLLHYAPTAETLRVEPEAIWAFLGSDRLATPIIEHQPDLVLHGHAHAGAFEGRLGGVPVFNVSVPVIGRDFWVFELTGSARHPAEIH